MQRAICKVHRVCPYAERFKSIPYDVPLGYDAYVDSTAAKGFATELLREAREFK